MDQAFWDAIPRTFDTLLPSLLNNTPVPPQTDELKFFTAKARMAARPANASTAAINQALQLTREATESGDTQLLAMIEAASQRETMKAGGDEEEFEMEQDDSIDQAQALASYSGSTASVLAMVTALAGKGSEGPRLSFEDVAQKASKDEKDEPLVSPFLRDNINKTPCSRFGCGTVLTKETATFQLSQDTHKTGRRHISMLGTCYAHTREERSRLGHSAARKFDASAETLCYRLSWDLGTQHFLPRASTSWTRDSAKAMLVNILLANPNGCSGVELLAQRTKKNLVDAVADLQAGKYTCAFTGVTLCAEHHFGWNTFSPDRNVWFFDEETKRKVSLPYIHKDQRTNMVTMFFNFLRGNQSEEEICKYMLQLQPLQINNERRLAATEVLKAFRNKVTGNGTSAQLRDAQSVLRSLLPATHKTPRVKAGHYNGLLAGCITKLAKGREYEYELATASDCDEVHRVCLGVCPLSGQLLDKISLDAQICSQGHHILTLIPTAFHLNTAKYAEQQYHSTECFLIFLRSTEAEPVRVNVAKRFADNPEAVQILDYISETFYWRLSETMTSALSIAQSRLENLK